jgi:lysophospholipase L1-like esterase
MRLFTRIVAYRLLLLAVSTVISLAGAELLFRWHVQRTYRNSFPEATGDLIPLQGPQIFAFRPNITGVATGGVDPTHTFPYRTNSHGLRDRERSTKQPGARRVLVIGDSYTWGYAVAEEDAYPQAAERLLHERGRPDIEVVNGAVPDYNSRQERLLLAQLLPLYEPDAVFLGYVVNAAEPSTAMPVPPQETDRHAFSWFLTEEADHLNRHVFRRRLLPSSKANVGSTYLDGFEEGSVKWRDSREAIREMRDLSAARGIPFSVLILPDVTQSLDDRYAWRTIHSAVARWGADLSIPTFDLLDEFRGQDNQTLWVPWDGHPNAAAHMQIAGFLVARILEQLPAQASR